MTPRGLRWASITLDMLLLTGLGLLLATTAWLWLPFLGFKAWRQRLEIEMGPQRNAHVIALEGYDGPRNDRDQPPAENHQA